MPRRKVLAHTMQGRGKGLHPSGRFLRQRQRLHHLHLPLPLPQPVLVLAAADCPRCAGASRGLPASEVAVFPDARAWRSLMGPGGGKWR